MTKDLIRRLRGLKADGRTDAEVMRQAADDMVVMVRLLDDLTDSPGSSIRYALAVEQAIKIVSESGVEILC